MGIRLRSAVGGAVAFLALFLSGPCAYCQSGRGIPKGGAINHEGGYDDLSPYQVTTIVSLAQLPAAVRGRLLDHLVNRLESELSQKLRFDSGQIVDLDKMHRVNPDTKQYKWIVPTYTLDFTFTDPAQGIALYWAQIGLSSTGAVVREINLPHMKKYATSRVQTSLIDAVAAAVKLGFDPAHTDAELRYDTRADAVVWRLSQVFSDDWAAVKYHYVEIDIYNGQTIKHADGHAIH